MILEDLIVIGALAFGVIGVILLWGLLELWIDEREERDAELER